LAEPLIEELSPEMFEEKKNQFLVSLKNSNLDEIELETRVQTNSEAWYRERRLRLTASRFGQICKMRNTTSCKNTVNNILYVGQRTCSICIFVLHNHKNSRVRNKYVSCFCRAGFEISFCI